MKFSEKLYLVYKLEFLCLKWVVVDKFKDYLYNNFFEVRMDNNLLIYVIIFVKFDVIGYCWFVVLSNYNFKIYYRFGKLN